ncbi:t-SNARE [Hysterangium stoloniferum]|nr:t-SNARE [Hysterangium stoloniferum]
MARDRLSALRAQQQVNYNDRWSYPTHPGAREPNRPPAAYVQLERHSEISDVHDVRWSYAARPEFNGAPHQKEHKRHSDPFGDSHACSSTAVSDYSSDKAGFELGYIDSGDQMARFYGEISSIQDSMKTFNDNVSRISDLHARSLNSTDWATARRSTHQLEGLMKETSQLGDQVKCRIRDLHQMDFSGRDGQIRMQQTGMVKHKFVQAIQSYQQVEQAYRVKYKQRLERQLRVVNPDATTEEIKAVVEGDHDGQLFTQMLQTSNRYGESRAVFREVNDRHDDIKKIERTLGDLARLFNDMDTLVMRSGETIDAVQAMAVDVEKHAEVGQLTLLVILAYAKQKRPSVWLEQLVKNNGYVSAF